MKGNFKIICHSISYIFHGHLTSKCITDQCHGISREVWTHKSCSSSSSFIKYHNWIRWNWNIEWIDVISFKMDLSNTFSELLWYFGTSALVAYLSLISSQWCFLLVLLWSQPYSGIVLHLFPLHYEPAKLPEKHQVEIVHVVLTISRLTIHQMLPRTDHLLHYLST